MLDQVRPWFEGWVEVAGTDWVLFALITSHFASFHLLHLLHFTCFTRLTSLRFASLRSAHSTRQGYRWDLTDSEAQELGRRAIVAAGHRDAYSGNTNNLFHVRENGWEFLGNKDISELWYAYEAEKKELRAKTSQAVEGEGMQVE